MFATATALLTERTSPSRSIGIAFAGLAVALATTFAACGSWQAWALIDGAREIARDIDVARATGHNPPEPRANARVIAAGKATRPPSASAPMAATSRGGLDDASALIARAPGAAEEGVTRAFEALAEATEKAIPVGSGVSLGDALLDDPEGILTLGQPPPPGYPRADCDGIFVYIVTLVEGAPLSSSASIGVGETGPARFRRPGHKVGTWTLLAISDDWSGLQPKVWMAKNGTVCLAKLAGNPTRSHQTAAPPEARQTPRPAAARPAPKPAQARQAKKPAARPKARRR